MKYAIEMGSGAMIRMSDLIKTGSGIQRLRRGGYKGTEHGDLVSLLFVFQNKGSRLKVCGHVVIFRVDAPCNLPDVFLIPVGIVFLWLYSPCGPWPLFSFGRTPWTGDQPVANAGIIFHQK
jgi:hypothetical protein